MDGDRELEKMVIRPARTGEGWRIRFLVLSARLDPTGIEPSRFHVVECEEKVIACGQLRPFVDALELGSLVVSPAWRGRGIGTALTRYLIERADRPLYLECLGSRLVAFYSHFGFVPVAIEELPAAIARKFRTTAAIARLFGLPLTIMHYRGGTDGES
jgi:amino-acid N-acetyltransferase